MKDIQEKKILDLLQAKEYASVEELATLTGTSPSTIRRALNSLQAKNLITRTHGGAKIHMESNVSPSFTFRFHQNSFEKKKMALSAIKLIKDGDIVFLDGSTSAYYIAEYLNEFKDIRVITNGIDTLSLLSKNKITAYSTGGLVSSVNPSVLVGRYAENTIENFYADIAFISAQALDERGEIFDCFEEEIFLRRAMLKNAKKKVFLCDSTKVAKTSAYHLCSIKDMDYIVSNTSLSKIAHSDAIKQIITDK
jgi:DeoR/GlpR family transcriptional regulator of sugar metabolism